MKTLISTTLRYASGKRFGVTSHVGQECRLEVNREQSWDVDEHISILVEHAPATTDGSRSGWTIGQAKGDSKSIVLAPALARRLGEALLRIADSKVLSYERFAIRPNVAEITEKESEETFVIVEGTHGVLSNDEDDDDDSAD